MFEFSFSFLSLEIYCKFVPDQLNQWILFGILWGLFAGCLKMCDYIFSHYIQLQWLLTLQMSLKTICNTTHAFSLNSTRKQGFVCLLFHFVLASNIFSNCTNFHNCGWN